VKATKNSCPAKDSSPHPFYGAEPNCVPAARCVGTTPSTPAEPMSTMTVLTVWKQKALCGEGEEGGNNEVRTVCASAFRRMRSNEEPHARCGMVARAQQQCSAQRRRRAHGAGKGGGVCNLSTETAEEAVGGIGGVVVAVEGSREPRAVRCFVAWR